MPTIYCYHCGSQILYRKPINHRHVSDDIKTKALSSSPPPHQPHSQRIHDTCYKRIINEYKKKLNHDQSDDTKQNAPNTSLTISQSFTISLTSSLSSISLLSTLIAPCTTSISVSTTSSASIATSLSIESALDWTLPLPSSNVTTARIVILFLAHEGVQHPSLWWYWWQRNVQARNEVAFVVHASNNLNNKPDHHGFVNHHRLFQSFNKTKWGDFNLVQAYIRCIKHILQTFPALQIVYLVSGYCIPITPIEQLLRDNNQQSRCSYTASPFELNAKTQHIVDETITRINNELQYTFDKSKFLHHHQWIALIKSHLQILVKTDLKPWNLFDQYLTTISHEQHYKLMITAPDEYVPMSILKHANIPDEQIKFDNPITEFKHKTTNTSNAYLWASWDLTNTQRRKLKFDTWTRTPQGNIRTEKAKPLIHYIEQARNDGVLFYRKINHTVSIPLNFIKQI